MQIPTYSDNQRLRVRTVVRLGAASLVVGLATFAVAVFPVQPASAAPPVTVTNCSGSASVPGSLPYAVADAASGETINFAPSLSCPSNTITLADTIVIGTDVTIDGPGANVLAVSGNYSVMVFSVDGGGTGSTISGLTIENGSALEGGGINIDDADLTVTDSTLSGNSASNFGGAIYNASDLDPETTLTITDSTLSGNDAEIAGAIDDAFANSTITDSTISGNSASFGGSDGIDNSASSTLDVSESTIVNNNNADYAGNGISNGGTANFAGTIMALDGSGGACQGTEPNDLGYNIDDDGSCGFSGTSISDSSTLDASLGSLAENGGPTETIALEPGSPAIDLVDSATLCATPDQRGVAGPTPVCDTGAYETSTLFSSSTPGFTSPVPDAVPSTICSVTITADGGAGGASELGGAGAAGGSVTAGIPVIPGSQFSVEVGGAGTTGGPSNGGTGGTGGGGGGGQNAGGGGGASVVSSSTGLPLVVAGGGGGAVAVNGGGTGTIVGGNGGGGNGTIGGGGGGGGGGGIGGPGGTGAGSGGSANQPFGGAGGNGNSTGGNGGASSSGGGGIGFGAGGGGEAGGGAGYGGGGGGGNGGNGGGGSSYVTSMAPTSTIGTSSGTGDGQVTISYNPATDSCQPAIALTKSANVSSYSASGTVIIYSYKVTNTGNVPLTAVGVTDPMPGLSAISCPSSTLALNASETCTATYTTTVADLEAGSISNTGTASGTFNTTTVTASSTLTIPAKPCGAELTGYVLTATSTTGNFTGIFCVNAAGTGTYTQYSVGPPASETATGTGEIVTSGSTTTISASGKSLSLLGQKTAKTTTFTETAPAPMKTGTFTLSPLP